MNSPIFERLVQILRLEKRDPKWFPVAEQVLNTIYCLGDKPSELVTAIIKEQTRKVLDVIRVTVEGGSGPESEVANPGGKTGSSDAMQIEEVEDNSSDVGGEAVVVDIPAKTTMVDSWELTKLLFMIGHVAIKEIVLLELVESNLKAQKARTESERRARPVSRDEEEEEELNQVAGSAEDDIGDAIASIRERELLYGGTSLLAHFAPLVVHVCSNPSLYSDPTLQVHAITALTKLMCISVSFCEKHLPLLLSILRRSKSPVIRSNIAIALGDVTVCFSNLMGENVQYLYEPLRDDDLKVKRSMLMVLTHLILNGMIKVKGQLGEMAKCLEDPDPRVVDLAKLFFTELSSKDNAIYNNLPDIISSLSGDREDCVSEVKFGRIMRFLFDFIKDKDKQAENVIEKLCHRYRVTTDPRQWRDIALCLTLLPYKSERSVRRLVDGFSCYQEALADDTVYRHLSDIGTKVRGQSFQKQDAKHVVDEFLIKLSQGRARATGEEVSAKAGMMDVKDSSAATTNTSGLRTALGDMEIYSDDDDL
ncbi:condensin complex non-SMC subunit Cnd1 [Spiromyces aspiralis]|uniref:Condensin complex non-SMC subunit Cnd1 n=1 Tax=Spiromyces aspiralis TaxID=68401 RepID=A0ACC1HIG7_9FUNG|nr:condensin complex non-SMC subunit Cnd1 [Spiromyces aspiralis]